MGQFKVVFYTDNKGNCPFLDYYKKLKKEKEKGIKESRVLFNAISIRFRHLREIGTRKGMPDFRYIKGSKYSIWEIRIKHKNGYFRIFIYRHNDKYIILNYFWKKGKKTPAQEIRKAEKLVRRIKRKFGGD